MKINAHRIQIRIKNPEYLHQERGSKFTSNPVKTKIILPVKTAFQVIYQIY